VACQLDVTEASLRFSSDSHARWRIMVARRTIAKYRESLQILPVNLRKSI